MEIDNLINNLVEGMYIKHGVEKLLIKIKNLDRWTNKRCGNCSLWMTRQCPLEINVNGRNHGPNMNTYGCDKFDVKSYQVIYRDKEIQEILKDEYIKYIKESFLIKIGLLKIPTEILSNC